MTQVEQETEWKLRTAGEFQQFFQHDLAPCLAGCEADRKRVARNVVLLISIVGGLAVIAALFVLNSGEPGLLMLVAIVAVAIIAIGYHAVTNSYRKKFKGELVSQIVRFLGGFEYWPDRYIDQHRFLESRIFEHRIDRYRGEDFISGLAGKTHFECSEVHAEYKTTTTDSKGRRRTHWHTIFKGLYFIADFNKHFVGTTLVLPDSAEATFGWLGQKLQEMNFSRPGELVKLEDPEFEKLFVVYGTDQIEARYILSPALMRRLVSFRSRLGHAVHLSFVGGSVYIAVNPGKNLLEPSIFSEVCFETCSELFEDLTLVLGIIEELNLNTRIWSKQ